MLQRPIALTVQNCR